MLEELTRSMFAERIGEAFRIQFESGEPLIAELIEVGVRENPAEAKAASLRSESFSLLFRVPVDAPRQQGTCQIEHDAIGAFNLFLVPVGQDDAGLHFEAIFN